MGKYQSLPNNLLQNKYFKKALELITILKEAQPDQLNNHSRGEEMCK